MKASPAADLPGDRDLVSPVLGTERTSWRPQAGRSPPLRRPWILSMKACSERAGWHPRPQRERLSCALPLGSGVLREAAMCGHKCTVGAKIVRLQAEGEREGEGN